MGGYGGADGGVTLQDLSDEITLLSVQGPLSQALLAPLVGGGALDDLGSFGFSTAKEVSIAGVRGIRLIRLTFVGELGFELHMPSAAAAHVYAAIRQAGEALSAKAGRPVRDAGYFAIDSLSAEKSFRHWHADLGCADTPMEAAIGFTVLPKLKRADARQSLCGVRRSKPSACRRPLLQHRLQRHLRRVALPHRFHRLEQRLALPGEQERVRLVCG